MRNQTHYADSFMPEQSKKSSIVSINRHESDKMFPRQPKVRVGT